jgi:hypothetical protein
MIPEAREGFDRKSLIYASRSDNIFWLNLDCFALSSTRMQWQNFLGYKYLVASGLSRSSLSLVVLRCHADVTLSLIHKARKKKEGKKTLRRRTINQ